jgi:hypothetical protein
MLAPAESRIPRCARNDRGQDGLPTGYATQGPNSVQQISDSESEYHIIVTNVKKERDSRVDCLKAKVRLPLSFVRESRRSGRRLGLCTIDRAPHWLE